MNTNARVGLWLLVVSSLTACEASHELGSDCPDGICPLLLGRAAPDCRVRESLLLVRFADYEEEVLPDPPPEFVHTVPEEPEGFGVRRLFWILDRDFELPDGSLLAACSDAPYLEEPDAESLQTRQLQRWGASQDEPNPRVCRMKEASIRSSGDVEVEGWYPAETTPTGRRLRFTSSVPTLPVDMTLASMRSAAQTISRKGDLTEVDPAVCSLPEDSAEHDEAVGRACLPTAITDGVFRADEVVVDTGSRECATGACLVYQLKGDPANPCAAKSDDPACRTGAEDPPKASQEEVEDRAYCSCRCDAPEGDPGELCSCKPGFSCVPALLDAPPGIRGSYCVKNRTFSTYGG